MVGVNCQWIRPWLRSCVLLFGDVMFNFSSGIRGISNAGIKFVVDLENDKEWIMFCQCPDWLFLCETKWVGSVLNKPARRIWLYRMDRVEEVLAFDDEWRFNSKTVTKISADFHDSKVISFKEMLGCSCVLLFYFSCPSCFIFWTNVLPGTYIKLIKFIPRIYLKRNISRIKIVSCI